MTMKTTLSALAVLGLSIASAQVTASLSGTVMDQSGAAISGANVTVRNLESGSARDTVTDGRGYYQFSSLPVGAYGINVTKAKFAGEVRSGIRLSVGQDATVDLNLRIGESSEQITVTGDAAMVSPTNGDVTGLVGEKQIKDLPLNGRSYDELMTLDPGVVNFTWEKTGGVGVSN